MRPLAPVLDSLLHDLKTGLKKDRSGLHAAWPQIVGGEFAPHTKPNLLEGGTLCVWVDNSVLAYELSQRYGLLILKRTQQELGEETVQKIIFRVGQIR